MSISRLPRLLIAFTVAATVTATGLVTTQAVGAEHTHGHGDGQEMAGAYWEDTPRARVFGPDGWPTADTVIERLQAHGITPILTEGYDDPVYERNANLDGRGTTPRAVMMHDTGTTVPAYKLLNTHSLNWILNGVKNSNGKTVRACHFYVARDGSVYFIYARRTWHAGAGDSMFGIPSNMMNGYSYGIEIESQGGGIQDLTPEQFTAASKVAAAALEASELSVDRLIDHKFYAGRVQGKVDTAYDLNMWKSLVATDMGTTYVAPVVSPNPMDISVETLRDGASGPYVKRYQKALRKYAARRGIRANAYNPSGATGTYGSETRALTKAVNKSLKRASAKWKRHLSKRSKVLPSPKLIRKIGMNPIS